MSDGHLDFAPAGMRDERRRPRIGLWIALTATLALLCCGGGISALFLDQLSGTNAASAAFTCGKAGVVDINSKMPRIGPYSEDQIRNAAIIITVGHEMKVPPRGWIIAVATAMQESSLTNHGFLGDRNDHDSLGLFQQRPSQGWGTPEQVMDPRYSSRKFYQKLVTISNWATRPLTEAAQAVQRSAFPDAYAKHESLATTIVNTLADGAGLAPGTISVGDLRCANPGEIAASGWTSPVPDGIVSGFRTSSRPTHNGVDLGASRYDQIHAAAAGVVIVSKCDVGNCDRDGSPSTPGCGWFVDILHADQIITRYCHMVRRPFVRVGDRVTAGQVIGQVGTSGHSSGPHLHFETHLDGDRSGRGAVNPVSFMAARGAPLGSGE
ncbi:murein DD-endopeptidase MepM/ murein hydrolase activator NlpD [Allocatelliglobosispora scoriae]|uniref:Murein DD-endopeptidase MepM/ murein hydrolase activator NlpD n=1 Tax=Allocatelliglobosispora scoriae TaxID=643052 RepID=A0A841BQB5_9ACTN|nr:M23 family metallopeptidase [Allocatelliglobosispora scoriae]MBB5871257.1 murein DD-endopeptidase MepM/ murein hydrolase activator NlpD [Allocatelliglobosispora scoriae]